MQSPEPRSSNLSNNLPKELFFPFSPEDFDPNNSDQLIGKQRENIWNTLVASLRKVKYHIPSDRDTEILDIGCGDCVEGIVLNAYFSGSKFGVPKTQGININGIDIDAQAIERARVLCTDYENKISDNLWGVKDNYKFHVADARYLEQIDSLPQSCDVVFMRHPHVLSDIQTWSAIFAQAANRLRLDGLLICTVYLPIERDLIINWVSSSLTLCHNDQNPFKTYLTQTATGDNYVLVFQKEEVK